MPTDSSRLTRWRSGQRAELHMFERGGHGFGFSPRGAPTDNWIDVYLAWLGRR